MTGIKQELSNNRRYEMKERVKRSVHSNLRTQRLCAGTSLTQAGQLVGLSANMISMAERGKRRMNKEAVALLLKAYRLRIQKEWMRSR